MLTFMTEKGRGTEAGSRSSEGSKRYVKYCYMLKRSYFIGWSY